MTWQTHNRMTGQYGGTWQVTWTIQKLTPGNLWLVVEVPRGPVMGCHMAPCGWLMVCVKLYGFPRGRTPDLFSWKWTSRIRLTTQPMGGSYYIYGKQ
jgi:hypothetical protein